MILLLFGAPGSGKGTQSALLVQRHNFLQISTGDLLRNAVKNESNIGKIVKAFLDEGQLVPDDVVIDLIGDAMVKINLDDKSNIIFDGFPRTVSQASSLITILSQFDMKIDCSLFIKVDETDLISRLIGRRICIDCSSVYHIETHPCRKFGVCDRCGGKVIQRSDDKEEVIVARMSAYNTSVDALKKLLSNVGRVIDIDGDQAVEAVYTSIVRNACIA